MDGSHTIERCHEVTERALRSLFSALYAQRVALTEVVLKPNMVLSGTTCTTQANGTEVAERNCGEIFLKGPSVMGGYYRDDEATLAALSEDGWLDTGDIGYRVGDNLYITARSKDVIIIKGRNIWPNDMEVVAQRGDGVRLGGVAAFSIAGSGDDEIAVMVVEPKERDGHSRYRLSHTITKLMHEHSGINIIIDLVRPGTLPRTSSGKLSRFQSREAFLERQPTPALHLPDQLFKQRKTA